MKALILCAGYATRLYPLTVDKPKHLLPIADKPMLNYAIENLEKVSEIDQIYLVTNHKFFPKFQDWIKTLKIKKKIEVIDDGTMSDDIKLGAIGDMKFVIDKIKINDDLLVFAGDNLFQLQLTDFIKFSRSKNAPAIAVYDVGSKELVSKYSEVKLDKDKKVTAFTEKPPNPETTFAAICMYLFPKNKLSLVNTYISEGNNPDQPGRYIQWLHKREAVYGFVFTDKWYDIGDINQYNEADKDYRDLLKK